VTLREKTTPWRRYRYLDLAAGLAIATAFCTLAVPLLHSGFPLGHDLAAHLTYTYLFDRALDAGQFPVRWTAGVRPGDAQPLFNFYQPGFYYLVQLVHALVPSLATSMKVAVLVMWAAGTTFMLRLQAHRDWLAAAFGAVVFAGAPYLLLDLNVRAAFPEFVAIMCAVGTVWAIGRLFTAPGPGRAAWLACLLAASMVCHLPATIIFSPLFVAVALRHGLGSPDRWRAWRWCAAAVLLAVGLSAFYVVPALGERHLVRMDALTQGYFEYRDHFVEPAQWLRFDWGFGSSVPGPGDGMSFQVGAVQWVILAAATGCALVAALKRRLTPDDWDVVFWLGVVAFALFMTTAASQPIWDAVPQLSYLQFPWRFLMLVAVACGCLAANLVARLDRSHARALAVTAAVVAHLVLSRDQRHPAEYLPRQAMDIDRPGWSQTPQAQQKAFVEPGYSPADPHARVGMRETSLRRWADRSTAATGAVTLLLVTGATPWRRRREDHRNAVRAARSGGASCVSSTPPRSPSPSRR
jgi:hypothetical protein